MSLGPSGKFLDPAGTHPECELGYWTLVAKFAFFSRQALKWCMQPSNCLKIYPIASYPVLALLHHFGFLKQGGG